MGPFVDLLLVIKPPLTGKQTRAPKVINMGICKVLGALASSEKGNQPVMTNVPFRAFLWEGQRSFSTLLAPSFIPAGQTGRNLPLG